MSKTTINDAIITVLKANGKSMSADAILKSITDKGLYAFKTSTPSTVVRAQLRRHARNLNLANSSNTKLYQIHEDSTYSLI